MLVKAWVKRSTPGSRGEMHVEMWGVKEYTIEAGLSARRNFRSPQTRYDPAANCVPQGAIGGFDVDVYRVFKKGGKTVKTETDTAVYQAADRIICGEKPTPKPPATPPPAD